jgi:hypothetical protein
MDKLHKCKNIWLNTTNSTIANNGTDALRRVFRFNNLPLIQIKKRSFLRIISLTISGAHNEATNHNWEVKLHNINFNQTSYYNSDNFAEPTIAQFNFSPNNTTIQSGFFKLELEPQDIHTITLEVFNETGEGLIKNNTPINIHLGLSIEEIDE